MDEVGNKPGDVDEDAMVLKSLPDDAPMGDVITAASEPSDARRSFAVTNYWWWRSFYLILPPKVSCYPSIALSVGRVTFCR